MESIIRGLVTYAFLFLVFRIAGKRTLAQTSPFELVLLLIISETVQQAMVDSDHSVTNAFLLVMTLVGTSIFLSIVRHRSEAASRWLDGLPVRVVREAAWDQEVADKVAPEVAEPIQKMADIMKKVAETSLGTKSSEQTAQLSEQNNKIGEVCKSRWTGTAAAGGPRGKAIG